MSLFADEHRPVKRDPRGVGACNLKYNALTLPTIIGACCFAPWQETRGKASSDHDFSVFLKLTMTPRRDRRTLRIKVNMSIVHSSDLPRYEVQ